MNLRRRFRAYLRLARPGNLVIAAVSIAAGAAVSAPVSLGTTLWVILGGVLVAAGGNAVNDYCDRDTDRQVKPHRPLPAGDLSAQGAARFSGSLLVTGWVLSLRGGWGTFGLVSAWVVLLVAYSRWLKGAGLPGNLVVSAVVASAFLLGGLCGANPLHSLIPAGFAFLFHLGREIIKDVEDIAGDSSAGVGTFAVRRGGEAALRLAAVVLSILIATTLLPYLTGTYNRIYLGAVILGVDVPMVYVIRTLLDKPSRRRLGMVSGLLKADMVVGIACILVGSGVV